MKTLAIAALLGTLAAGIAVAQTATPAVKPMRGDINADGKLSRAEFIKQAEARFALLDVDKDGSLTPSEARFGRGHGGRHGAFGRFGAMRQDGPPPPPGAGMRGRGPGGGMMRLDTDGDGRVTRAEYDAQSTQRFARMDANGDGTVDRAEMAALPGGGRLAGRIDADGNGTLTRAEYVAQSNRRFARMDANGDGVIDAAELQAGRVGRPAPPALPAAPPPAAPAPPAPTGA